MIREREKNKKKFTENTKGISLVHNKIVNCVNLVNLFHCLLLVKKYNNVHKWNRWWYLKRKKILEQKERKKEREKERKKERKKDQKFIDKDKKSKLEYREMILN